MFDVVMSGDTPRLVSLATAVPPIDLPQAEVTRRAASLFGVRSEAYEWLAPIYDNAAIENRHSCVPFEWYLEDHSFRDRNSTFLENATALLEDAARAALDKAGLAAGDIDSIVTVCTTGIATPSLDARLMRRMDFRSRRGADPGVRAWLRRRGAGPGARGRARPRKTCLARPAAGG